jgi:hypothetical protein
MTAEIDIEHFRARLIEERQALEAMITATQY